MEAKGNIIVNGDVIENGGTKTVEYKIEHVDNFFADGIGAKEGATEEDQEELATGKEENPIIEELLPIFFNVREEVEAFIRAVDGQKPTYITEKVNDLLKKEKISRAGSKGDLWAILHEYKFYKPEKSTWNKQVN